MRVFVTAVVTAALGMTLPVRAAAADASAFAAPSLVFGEPDAHGAQTPLDAKVWRLDFGGAPPAPTVAAGRRPLDTSAAVSPDADGQGVVRRPVAYTYSDAYTLRAKIHKYASFATLPLFGAQYLLGTKLDNGTGGESVRWTHAAIATTMVGLFTVNSVTGVWNLLEGRANPAGRTRRLVHGILMLASDAGFVATGMLAPTNDGGGNRSLHKSLAITSMGVASAGYLLMLFGQ